jgi:hypothetical protein
VVRASAPRGVPCSSSTSIPIRNCSTSNGELAQSMPICSPAARACSAVKCASSPMRER